MKTAYTLYEKFSNNSKRMWNTVRVDGWENSLIKRTRNKVPDLVGMWKQSFTEKFSSTWRKPNKMNLYIYIWFNDSFYNQLRSIDIKTELARVRACMNIYLIFFFKTESSSEETCVICICFYIWYASSLKSAREWRNLKWIIRLVNGDYGWMRIGYGNVKLTWYLRPYPIPDETACIDLACLVERWICNY